MNKINILVIIMLISSFLMLVGSFINFNDNPTIQNNIVEDKNISIIKTNDSSDITILYNNYTVERYKEVFLNDT